MKRIEVSIAEDSNSIDPVELGEFLFLFKGVAAGLEIVLPSDFDATEAPSPSRRLKSRAMLPSSRPSLQKRSISYSSATLILTI